MSNKRLSSSRSVASLRDVLTPVKRPSNVGMNNPHAKSSAKSIKASSPQSAFQKESNISVYVRCRSRNEREIGENSAVVVSTLGQRGKEVVVQSNQNTNLNKTYTFDRVFGAESHQEAVFEGVAQNVLKEMLQGYNCTIFAYGQTGTGKTYSMIGDIESSAKGALGIHAGIIPRVLVQLFKDLKESGCEPSVRISFIELYNEELKDLLAPDYSDKKVRIYDDQDKKSIVVQGMQEIFINDATEGLALLSDGSYKRQVAATQCNDLSSRSHTVFTVTVHMKKVDPISGEEYVRVGKLNLVDLAGSENINRSGAENKRAREAGMINQSLLTLGRVINCLVDKSPHIPYRESKLTRLLQDSLGGQTKTCILATISPAKVSIEETLSTLEYASRAKNIKNKPQVNQSMTKQMLISEYIQEIESLRKDLAATRDASGGVYMTTENHKRLLEESESRKLLVEEQKLRIDLLEDQSKRFQETYEQALEERNEAKRQSQDAQHQLTEALKKLEAADKRTSMFQRKYQDETIYREELERVHAESENVYNSLVEIVSELNSTKSHLYKLVSDFENAFATNQVDLDTKKKHLSNILDENLTKTTKELYTQHKSLMECLSFSLGQMVQEQEKNIAEKLTLLGDTQNALDDDSQSIKQRLKSYGAAMEVEMSEALVSLSARHFQNLQEWAEDLKEKLRKNVESHINEISGVESSLQNSYHSLGSTLKQSFELVENQVMAQVEELQKLSKEYGGYNIKVQAALASHFADMTTAHEEEFATQREEQEKLIEQVTSLIRTSTEKRCRRASAALHNKQDQLSALNEENVQFAASHAESLLNITESEAIFASAIKEQKSALRSAVVEKFEKNRQELQRITDNARDLSEAHSENMASLVGELSKSEQSIASGLSKVSHFVQDNQQYTEKELQQLDNHIKAALMHFSAALKTLPVSLKSGESSIIGSYTREQEKLLQTHNEQSMSHSKRLDDEILSMAFPAPQHGVPELKQYTYPSGLPKARRKRGSTGHAEHNLPAAEDIHSEAEITVLREAESLTPLPMLIPDVPMVENTPISMNKKKQLPVISRLRPSGKGETKVLQQLNM